MILFHGGFHFGGTLTRVLMWLLIITVFSGVFGAALQHYIPRMMTSDAPPRNDLRRNRPRSLAPSRRSRSRDRIYLWFPRSQQNFGREGQRAGGFTALRPSPPPPFRCAPQPPSVRARAPPWLAAPEIILLSEEESAPLRRFFLDEMRPFPGAPQATRPASRRHRQSGGPCFPDCALCCPPPRTSPWMTSKTFATKRASSHARSACIAGCTLAAAAHPVLARIDFARRYSRGHGAALLAKEKNVARTRTTKKLAQRIDLNYFKRPTPLKRAKILAKPPAACACPGFGSRGAWFVRRPSRVIRAGVCRNLMPFSKKNVLPVTRKKPRRIFRQGRRQRLSRLP